MREYKAPENIAEVYSKINLFEALSEDDPRYVNTEKARGDFKFSRLLKHLSVNPAKYEFFNNSAPKKNYIAFCGHRGCGKSTELHRIAKRLDTNDLFFVVFVETSKELDINNIHYADVLFALSKKLLQKANENSVEVDSIFTERLETWFAEKILTAEDKHEKYVELKTGLKGKIGIPYLYEVFANITGAFKAGSTYKEELRRKIQNNFSAFAEAFNQLLEAIKLQLPEKAKRKEVLFIVDDSEKWRQEDSHRFFEDEAQQLLMIQSNFVYCAPINLLYESKRMKDIFDTFTFPMIKIYEKDRPENAKKTELDDEGYLKNAESYNVLRSMLLKRAPRNLFDSDETIEKLIKFSGGNPRDLLRLVQYTYLEEETEIFTKDAVDESIKKLADDYRRFLHKEHYEELYKTDNTDNQTPNEKTDFLLFHLALLEYNSFWWRSHPVIRLLPQYKAVISD